MIFGGKDPKPKSQSTRKAPIEIETILGSNTSIRGDIRSSGGVRVDGDFSGTIEIAGNLIIGENAQVIADITANNVQVQGTAKGDVTARRLEILDTGKLWGDISVDSFVLDDGGLFQGKSKMHADIEPPLLEPPPTASNIVDVEPTSSI